MPLKFYTLKHSFYLHNMSCDQFPWTNQHNYISYWMFSKHFTSTHWFLTLSPSKYNKRGRSLFIPSCTLMFYCKFTAEAGWQRLTEQLYNNLFIRATGRHNTHNSLLTNWYTAVQPLLPSTTLYYHICKNTKLAVWPNQSVWIKV